MVKWLVFWACFAALATWLHYSKIFARTTPPSLVLGANSIEASAGNAEPVEIAPTTAIADTRNASAVAARPDALSVPASAPALRNASASDLATGSEPAPAVPPLLAERALETRVGQRGDMTAQARQSETRLSAARTLYRTTSRVNIRSGAGTKFPRIGSLERGTEVQIESEHEGWYSFRTENGDVAFVSGKYVKPAR